MAGKPPLIALLGPTAVGKTALGIELALAIGGEIISADSRQIYRFMDIGTAKPTPEQRERVPHHLLDVVDPDENLSLAQFQRLAYAAIQAVLGRNRIPIVVGGTGQYLTALVEGWQIPEVPPNQRLRAELEAFAAAQGTLALHQRLAQADPEAARAIDHRNVRRVVRALEVCLETGQPISHLQTKAPPPFRIVQHGLTLERQALYRRADDRLADMLRRGLLDEIRQLLARGYSPRLPAMSGLGYRQIIPHILHAKPLDDALADARHATHAFIRRQYTWFRGHDTGILWHNMGDLVVSRFIEAVERWLKEQV